MNGNSSCATGNTTETCPPPGSSAGLAVGLTFFFLLLVIIACVIIYKYHPKIRGLLTFGRRESQGKEDCTGSPQAESHQYTSMIREQPAVQMPIYENLTVQAAASKPAVHPRSPDQPQEDLYLQYDTTDDAIYHNYPVLNSSLPDPQEEDVYIVPDSS